jgi:hypothetical protein
MLLGEQADVVAIGYGAIFIVGQGAPPRDARRGTEEPVPPTTARSDGWSANKPWDSRGRDVP